MEFSRDISVSGPGVFFSVAKNCCGNSGRLALFSHWLKYVVFWGAYNGFGDWRNQYTLWSFTACPWIFGGKEIGPGNISGALAVSFGWKCTAKLSGPNKIPRKLIGSIAGKSPFSIGDTSSWLGFPASHVCFPEVSRSCIISRQVKRWLFFLLVRQQERLNDKKEALLEKELILEEAPVLLVCPNADWTPDGVLVVGNRNRKGPPL